MSMRFRLCILFFFNDTATTEIYTLSLHDALPIFDLTRFGHDVGIEILLVDPEEQKCPLIPLTSNRSEEHTSELQSQSNLVCRLLLEKKKNNHDVAANAINDLTARILS